MAEDIFQLAKKTMQAKAASAAGQAQLKALDQTVVFDLSDGEPFAIEVKKGRARVKAGKPEAPLSFAQELLIKTDSATASELLEGKLGMADAFFAHRLWAYGLGWKGYATSWFSRLLRA